MNQIEQALKKYAGHLHQWSVKESKIVREENYLIRDPKKVVSLDQNRSVEQSETWLNVWVPGQKGRLGFARNPIDVQENIDFQIEKLLQKAHLADEEFWVFPKPEKATFSPPELCFPGFVRDLELGSQYFVDDCLNTIRKTGQASFNSAEVFVSRIEDVKAWSTGQRVSEVRSRIYSEVCFSAADDKDSNEFLVTRLGLHPEQINFPELCARSVQGAQALLKATSMPEGRFLVKVDAEILWQQLNYYIGQLRGDSNY
jgi:predicted Zn-dependent protease